MRHRNPYVILGVPYGSPRGMCSTAFARRAKQLKRSPDSQVTMTDLTWALNQVDEAIQDPELALEIYRIPADIQSIAPVPEDGVFRPPPETLPRRTASSDADQARLFAEAVVEARLGAVVAFCESRPVPSY